MCLESQLRKFKTWSFFNFIWIISLVDSNKLKREFWDFAMVWWFESRRCLILIEDILDVNHDNLIYLIFWKSPLVVWFESCNYLNQITRFNSTIWIKHGVFKVYYLDLSHFIVSFKSKLYDWLNSIAHFLTYFVSYL